MLTELNRTTYRNWKFIGWWDDYYFKVEVLPVERGASDLINFLIVKQSYSNNCHRSATEIVKIIPRNIQKLHFIWCNWSNCLFRLKENCPQSLFCNLFYWSFLHLFLIWLHKYVWFLQSLILKILRNCKNFLDCVDPKPKSVRDDISTSHCIVSKWHVS